MVAKLLENRGETNNHVARRERTSAREPGRETAASRRDERGEDLWQDNRIKNILKLHEV